MELYGEMNDFQVIQHYGNAVNMSGNISVVFIVRAGGIVISIFFYFVNFSSNFAFFSCIMEYYGSKLTAFTTSACVPSILYTGNVDVFRYQHTLVST